MIMVLEEINLTDNINILNIPSEIIYNHHYFPIDDIFPNNGMIFYNNINKPISTKYKINKLILNNQFNSLYRFIWKIPVNILIFNNFQFMKECVFQFHLNQWKYMLIKENNLLLKNKNNQYYVES